MEYLVVRSQKYLRLPAACSICKRRLMDFGSFGKDGSADQALYADAQHPLPSKQFLLVGCTQDTPAPLYKHLLLF